MVRSKLHDFLHDYKLFKLHYNNIQNLPNMKCLVVRRLLKSRIDGGKFKDITVVEKQCNI